MSRFESALGVLTFAALVFAVYPYSWVMVTTEGTAMRIVFTGFLCAAYRAVNAYDFFEGYGEVPEAEKAKDARLARLMWYVFGAAASTIIWTRHVLPEILKLI